MRSGEFYHILLVPFILKRVNSCLSLYVSPAMDLSRVKPNFCPMSTGISSSGPTTLVLFHKTYPFTLWTWVDDNIYLMRTIMDLSQFGSIPNFSYLLFSFVFVRMNEHFRMVFLFQGESCDTFISEFSKRHPTMVQSLQDLEDVAVQLDRMNKGAKISSVTGSSVGAIGGVLSIVGLALIPVTAGLSLGLTATGLGLGITSGVNSAVTTATEIGVNAKQQNKAKEVFQRFMEDVQSLQGCLDDVTNETLSKMEKDLIDLAEGVDGVLNNDKLNKEVIAGVGKVVAEEGRALLNVPRLVSDIPDIGQAAAKGSLALSKSARAGLIGLNALFIGMDVFFICKDSISLAKGTETEVSQFIRARAALWRSEVEAFQRMHDSLCKGQPTSEKNEALLETPYYPDSCTNNKEI
ncbi:apolipo L4 [Solea senegalensis]|uniref:Apolipo L4 n=1 Tax=Solea senegalensis TaxID=28829 RepID=A0AAV6RLM6_SOLSE|nr:apolipo L4 [Solea senegalensis]